MCTLQMLTVNSILNILNNAQAVVAGNEYPLDCSTFSTLHYVQFYMHLLHWLITFLSQMGIVLLEKPTKTLNASH